MRGLTSKSYNRIARRSINMYRFSVNRSGRYSLLVFLTLFALLFMSGAVGLGVNGDASGRNVPSASAATLDTSYADLGASSDGGDNLFYASPNDTATPRPTRTPPAVMPT